VDQPEGLFRSDVVQARKSRVEGEVILTQPLAGRVLTLSLVGLLAAGSAMLALGSYSRTESAQGILVTAVPSAKVIGLRPGQLTDLMVREGDLVRAGQTIGLVSTEQAGDSGESAIAQGLAASRP
jgi:membrane fusion protein